MNLESLYQRLPLVLQDAMCSVYGARLKWRRYGNASYRKLEAALCARDHWSHDKICDFSDERLSQSLRYCVEHVPYYRRLFGTRDLVPADVSTRRDLVCLPVLTKGAVRERVQDFHPDHLASIRHKIHRTSGSTGAGLVFPMALAGEQEQWAVWWRYRRRFGIDHSTWYAHFYGKSIVPLKQEQPPFWRVNWPGRQIFFSAYHLTPENLPAYVEELNRRQPPWIQGYPSLLALLAGYMLDAGRRLEYQPCVVTVGAESLLPHQKTAIERAFHAPCRQHYGMAEGVANISECPQGKLHVDEDYSCVEFLPIGNGLYRIVGTSFANPAFPLVRYDVGDVAEIVDGETCACGLPGRVVRAIDGRVEDYVVTPDGRRIGRMDHIFKNAIAVSEAQVYQPDASRVVFRIVKSASYGALDEAHLLTEARKRLGDEIEISFDYVDAIERTSRGKIRFVVSDLESGRIAASY